MATSSRKFDELNNLQSKSHKHIIPIHQYFEEMDLELYEIERRIQLAELLKEEFIIIFNLITSSDITDRDEIYDMIHVRYIDCLEECGLTEEEFVFITAYVNDIVDKLTDATVKHQNDEYYTSKDRATNIAENEANTIYNGVQYEEMKSAGYTHKIWVTMQDRHVRDTHMQAQGQKVEIDKPFVVGDSEMMFPRDYSLGASGEEISGCRCTVEYTKQ